MNTTLLGRISELDDVDDHQPVEHGTLTRCDVDGQMWPCATVETARRIIAMPVELLEMIDVGWFLAARYPDQLDEPPRRVKGIVAGYRDDEDRGRIYTLVGTDKGRPCVRELAARDVDPNMGDDALPNSLFKRNTYKALALHVGRHGAGDSTDVKYLAMALALAQSTT